MPTQSPYSKPPLSYNDQLDLLKSRGLTIEDDHRALHLLEHLSYYRLSGYWYPLLKKPKIAHGFKEGATFDKAFKMYCFDRKLRFTILDQLAKVEVCVRAKLIYIYSHAHGPFWYQESMIFRSESKHELIIGRLTEEYSRSDSDFVRNFKTKYSDPLPPSWILLELCSFGTLSLIISNLSNSPQSKYLSRELGLNFNHLRSWLHAMVYLRNVCAHHSRCWNREMQVYPTIPQTHNPKTKRKYPFPKNKWIDASGISNRRCYFDLCVLKYLLDIAHPTNSFKSTLSDLFASYPSVDIHKGMGFPSVWTSEPLWT